VTTPQPDREQSIDRLLRRAMRPGAAPAASEFCLDAETVAAWVDGALPADAAGLAEAHASTCARCQAMLAALVRASPPLPASDSWWRRRWFIAGLVPLTAGAVAIAIWVAVPKEATRIAPASVQVAAPSPADSPAPPSAPAAERAQPSRPATAQQEPPALADRLEKSAAPQQRAPAITPPTERKQEADLRRRDEQGKAKDSASPPAAASAASPLNETVALGRLNAGAVEIASPDASIRWRIGAAGMVQRSSDGGATWETLSIGATEDLTAASAPSATVCWIAGRTGIVLLTTNGREWQRVALPERVDIAAIQAIDGRAASVTTADGRTFRTSDGGLTWTPLQEF
jgi:photosynthesis system II assembly factor YCF48-like protein